MSNGNANSISIFVGSHFPSDFRTNGSLLVKFIEYYYQWLEAYENPIFVARKLLEYRDVDYIPEKFFQFLRQEFMKSIPTNNVVDDRLLLKHILDFYRAKGTEKAYKLLFRILYNDDIHFYYPGVDILRASDGRWVIDRSVRVLTTAELTDIAEIEGLNSGARARIDRVVKFIESGAEVTEVYLKNIHGVFQAGEQFKETATQTTLGTIQTALHTYDGHYQGTYGFLSWDKFLQDNFYYQEFSYELKTSQPVNIYREVVENLAHPAGTKLFGSITIVPDLNEGQYANLFSITALSAVGGLDLGIDLTSVIGFSDTNVGSGGVLNYEINMNLYSPSSSYNFTNANYWQTGNGFVDLVSEKTLLAANGGILSNFFVPGEVIQLINSANTNQIEYRMIKAANSTSVTTFYDSAFPLPTLNLEYLFKNNDNDVIESFITRKNDYSGLGTLAVSNKTLISDWASFTISDMDSLPIEAFDGTPRICIGTGTNFLKVNRGDILDILNSNGTSTHIVTGVASDTFLTIKENHTYGTVSGKTYKYWVI
jgi:hypothetical protein